MGRISIKERNISHYQLSVWLLTKSLQCPHPCTLNSSEAIARIQLQTQLIRSRSPTKAAKNSTESADQQSLRASRSGCSELNPNREAFGNGEAALLIVNHGVI